MDLREQLIKMADQDMRRVLRLLPKASPPKRAWVRTAVSQTIWEKFYPPLSAVGEDDPILLHSVWDYQRMDITEAGSAVPRFADAWTLQYWCACRRSAIDGLVHRITDFVTQPFGLAASVTEVPSSGLVDMEEEAAYVE